MIEQGAIRRLNIKILVISNVIKLLKNNKTVICNGNKPLRMATHMIDIIKEKATKQIEKIDAYEFEKTEDERANHREESINDIEKRQKPPVIESRQIEPTQNREDTTINRVRTLPATGEPKLNIESNEENKTVQFRPRQEEHETAIDTEIDSINNLVKATIERQKNIEERLKEENEKLRKATEQKNSNIIELKKIIEQRNRHIDEIEAQLQEKRERTAREREEAESIEAALKLFDSDSAENKRSISM